MIAKFFERFLELLDLSRLTTQVVEFLPRALVAVVILLVFLGVYRLTRRPWRLALLRTGMHEKLVQLLVSNIYFYVLLIVGSVMAAEQLGVNVGAAVAGLGIAGIAIGFAAQDSVANLISGFLIFWDKPFTVGDWIRTDDQYGCVANITLRTTRIRTPRNAYVIIPNKNIIDKTLENFSKHGDLRLEVPVGIAYKEDIAAARAAILDAIDRLDLFVPEPAPDVVVKGLGDSSVDLLVRGWLENAGDEPSAHFRVVEACKLALDEAGIEIPFPHLQLFVDDVAAKVWDRATVLRHGGAENAS